ncbi:hypothetical protein JOF53_004919 [Crossiella equi]|uniref:Uncharacterized protein n=1 Tax=Crossiella equi TaxID=130796 RepID=A0ABS5AHK2_9PSEU|nr:hypothetical protein [Crossiella equi]MBP2476047.1 hypothetical protein [Crossiella equi]
MAHDPADVWQPLRDRLCWAVVSVTTCLAILVCYYPVVRTITALGASLVATVLAVFSWRALTARDSARLVVAAIALLGAAALCFALIP